MFDRMKTVRPKTTKYVEQTAAAILRSHAYSKKPSAAQSGTAKRAKTEPDPAYSQKPPALQKQVTTTLKTEAFVPPPIVATSVHGNFDGSWCVDYRPVHVEHAVLQPESSRVLVEKWLRRRFMDDDPKGPKVLILKGPSGCGKASFVRALASSLGVVVEQPEGIDTFSKLLEIMREGACARTLSLSGDMVSRQRVWLFTGIDGYAEGADGDGDGDGDHADSRKKRRILHARKQDVLESIIGLIKRSCLATKTGIQSTITSTNSSAERMAPVVFTIHDFSNRTVRRLQHLDAILYANATALDREKCRYALTRLCEMLPVDTAAAFGTGDVETILTYCCGDVRQCVFELQKLYYGTRIAKKLGPAAVRESSRDTAKDVFETTRHLLAVERDVKPDRIQALLDVHANGFQFLFSNWMFNLDFGVRNLTALQADAAMKEIAAGCDAWCLLQEASAWRLGREPSLVQTESGVIAGVMRLRHIRATLRARTPGVRLEYFKPLLRQGRPAALDAVRTASLQGFGLKNIELNERLCCACAIASCIARGLYSLSAVVAKPIGDLAPTSLLHVDPFFSAFGIPRHVAAAALPDYNIELRAAPGQAQVARVQTDWKILDVEGWKRQYRTSSPSDGSYVHECAVQLRNCPSEKASEVARTFFVNVCERLRAETQRKNIDQETFFQVMEDHNAAVDLLDAFYLEHAL